MGAHLAANISKGLISYVERLKNIYSDWIAVQMTIEHIKKRNFNSMKNKTKNCPPKHSQGLIIAFPVLFLCSGSARQHSRSFKIAEEQR